MCFGTGCLDLSHVLTRESAAKLSIISQMTKSTPYIADCQQCREPVNFVPLHFLYLLNTGGCSVVSESVSASSSPGAS